MLRTTVAALIVVPLAFILVAFAVANRHIVTVSLDPFSAEPPAAEVTLPLFALVVVLLIIGVVIGGIAAWLRQVNWRRTARRLEREVGALRGEIAALKRAAGAPVAAIEPADPPERLQISPPHH